MASCGISLSAFDVITLESSLISSSVINETCLLRELFSGIEFVISFILSFSWSVLLACPYPPGAAGSFNSFN